MKLKEKYGVCRLDTTGLIPEWAKNSDFFSIRNLANISLNHTNRDFKPSSQKYKLL